MTLTWDLWTTEDDPNPWWRASSGDYRRVTDLVDRFRAGTLGVEALVDRLRSLGLVPHPLGCGYLLVPVPMPPPGVRFDHRIMPPDREGTIGELAMVRGSLLSREEWREVHAALHPECPAPDFAAGTTGP